LTHTAVVGPLRRRETGDGPPEGGDAVCLEQGVLLLDAEPGLSRHILLEDFDGSGARGACEGHHVLAEALAQHEDVRGASEWVIHDTYGPAKDREEIVMYENQNARLKAFTGWWGDFQR